MLGLPIRKLWLSNNQLHNLLPPRGGNAARKEEWLARLTHVCMSSNALRELPKGLLEHGTALVELDVAYNHALQVRGWVGVVEAVHRCTIGEGCGWVGGWAGALAAASRCPIGQGVCMFRLARHTLIGAGVLLRERCCGR